jgi:hypothetical protein
MIYFISEILGSGKVSRVKIGYSANPHKRLQNLQTGNANTLEITKIVPGDKRDERLYHDRFKSLHLAYEWFRFDGDLKTFIKR